MGISMRLGYMKLIQNMEKRIHISCIKKKIGLDTNGQGYGTEYLDSNGVWHHTSTLKPQNPGYNPEAAANTHIQVPQWEKIEK